MPRKRNLYEPGAQKPFRLSRSKVDSFLKCKRCFYLDRRLGVSHPPGFPFNLNSAVDQLLKTEFDGYREVAKPHPLMVEYGIDAVPMRHESLGIWRQNFKGVSYVDPKTNFSLFGAVDDLWRDNQSGETIVVDYKATSKSGEVTIDADWQISYKRQMEFYQWLLRKNGLDVSNTGYFVYCNGRRDLDQFDGKLDFVIKVIPYTGSDKWVDDTLQEILDTLESDEIPQLNPNCDYCKYVEEVEGVLNN
jgi:CRISPR/Cas system-associated exonuclease Cas4 (RecB family)